MSLCVVLRSPNGEVMMGADTALSIEQGKLSYRINNVEDDEKAIEHQGNLIFCSGLYDGCKLIRSRIRQMETFKVDDLQQFARDLFLAKKYPGPECGDTVILVCKTGGSIVIMRAKDNF